MERGSSTNRQLQSLVEAIKSTDVVECRVQSIVKLGDLDLVNETDLISVVECLTTFWEDFTCLDASQCMLNKTILHVAAKCLDSHLSSGVLKKFLPLVTKASTWCAKHLKMTLMSAEESQEEEHSNLFFQLLLDFLSLSAASSMALSGSSVLTDNALAVIIENFILEQLNLTKEVVSHIKFNSFGSEAVKAVQLVIDGMMKICRVYSLAVNWNFCDAKPKKDESSAQCEEVILMNHVVNITKCTIEKLLELGTIAANDGGNLVTILNVSWKGMVTLLELNKGPFTKIVNVRDIIVTLMSLVNEPLRCAAEAWSSMLKQPISVTEARRTFLPVKFYLINAVKISSLCSSQANLVYREVSVCVLMISTFGILMSYEKLLNAAKEVFSELLEQTSIDLLISLLNSADVKQVVKFELLDWLFSDECRSNSTHEVISNYCINSMVEIFSVCWEAMPGARILLLGRVALFHTLLRYSVGLEEDVKIKMAKKLGWFLDVLGDQDVYSSILYLQIPVAYASGKEMELVWQPMFSAILQALKTFMIVVSSSFAWVELEAFLLENLFHPHYLCWEIVMELSCFLVRYAAIDMVNAIIDKLCSLMKLLGSPESVLISGSPLRKMARTICLLLNNGTPSMVDHVYSSVFGDDRSQLSSVMHVALLLEGFPLNSLSDNSRSIAKQKIITDYFNFIGSFDDKFLTGNSSGALGIPVCALSSSLQSHQVSMSDVDRKTLKFLVAIIHNIRNSPDKQIEEHCYKLLSETLAIVSNMKHPYESDEMKEVILELQNLFISGPAASDTRLYLCKPYLARFMGGLGEMEMSESDVCAKSSAVWELYHMLFREQHWALVHLAIAAFGYFAARTSCNQLWRFVPQNAALSYDLMSGEVNEERFMCELKAFLEKETALLSIASSFEQLELLVKEGMVLKEMVQKISDIHVESMECGSMEIDVDNQSNKRRKLPSGICRGVELLQSGLKVISDSLSQLQQNHSENSELHDKFLTHFSGLEDVITHLMHLAGDA